MSGTISKAIIRNPQTATALKNAAKEAIKDYFEQQGIDYAAASQDKSAPQTSQPTVGSTIAGIQNKFLPPREVLQTISVLSPPSESSNSNVNPVNPFAVSRPLPLSSGPTEFSRRAQSFAQSQLVKKRLWGYLSKGFASTTASSSESADDALRELEAFAALRINQLTSEPILTVKGALGWLKPEVKMTASEFKRIYPNEIRDMQQWLDKTEGEGGSSNGGEKSRSV
jgi:hypothetical protein